MQNGIICIETEWLLTKRQQRRKMYTEPLVRFLGESLSVPYIYRTVATKDELSYYLSRIQIKEFQYSVIYFSFHGNRHLIGLEGETGEDSNLRLDDLTDMAGGAFEDRCVHFSSCQTMGGHRAPSERFVRETGAKMLSGYTKSVDVLDSAILDAAVITQYLSEQNPKVIQKNIEKLFGCGGTSTTRGLKNQLGLKFFSDYLS
jgi:hypothetical protein